MAGETVFPATETKRQLSKQPGPDAGSVTFSVTVRDGMPAFMRLAILEYAKWGYRYVTNHAIYVVFAALLVAIFMERLGLEERWRNVWSEMPYDVEAVLAMLGVLIFTVLIYYMSSPQPIYLIDFACYRPSDEFKISKKDFIDQARKSGKFDEASLEFQAKVLKSSGIGDETYIPKSIMSPTNCATMKEGREEASTVIFGALDELFEKSRIRPRDIDILVVNTSRFNPTPSVSAMIINKYKMRGNILSFNLGGMGCSAAIVAIDLARDMLNGNPNSLAVVVSAEMVTFTWYSGRNPSMLLSNSFFRMGCSAVLLSNRRHDFGRAKYQLQHLVRTHKGSDDRSFRSVYLREDDEGLKGLAINNDIMEVGRQAVKSNISMLGPRMLPLSEKLRLAAIQAWRNLSRGGLDGSKPQILEYMLAFDHICVNASSKAVLDELQKHLGLNPETMEAARMTLHRFGNTSSSSTWYELAYLEAKEKVQQGDRVWQLTFGSGFKCNTAVWRALRRPNRPTRNNPWLDCLDRYPVAV